MIPMEIYRRDDESGEYYVQFSAETIEQIHVKFMQDLKNRDIFNLEHDQAQTVPAFILESWIVDNPQLDKSFTTFGIEVPKDVGLVRMVNRHWGIQVLTTGSQAYCINPSRLEYFINKLEDYNYYIDVGLRDFAKDLKAYITQPNLVVQFPSYSDLRLKEVNDF